MFSTSSSAEAKDRLATATALATAMAAITYSLNVVTLYVTESTAGILDKVQLAGGFLIVAIFLPLFLFLKSRIRQDQASSSEGFIGAVFRKSGFAAFGITLMGMVILSMLNETLLSQITAETAVDIIITFALAIFSVSFFIISRFGLIDESAS